MATDANGWTVIDMGVYKIASKILSAAAGSRGAGSAWFLVSSQNLPVGATNLSTIRSIQTTVRITSNSNIMVQNFEAGSAGTTWGMTGRNDSGSTVDFGTAHVYALVVF